MIELIKFNGLTNEEGNFAEYAIDPRLIMVVTSMTLLLDGEMKGVAKIEIPGFEAIMISDPDKDVVKKINEARRLAV